MRRPGLDAAASAKTGLARDGRLLVSEGCGPPQLWPCFEAMRCVVTAGPTFEPLDQVRRLTNFSTGSLGCELAHCLLEARCDVDLWLGSGSTTSSPRLATRLGSFSTTSDLIGKFEELSAEAPFRGAIFHAAAVSDFMFGRLWESDENGVQREVRSGKISSRDGALLAELIPTPKIIMRLRGLFPNAWLVGWKYEVEGGRERAVERGTDQMREARTDLCVLNGPAYGQGFGLLSACGKLVDVQSRRDLCEALLLTLPKLPQT